MTVEERLVVVAETVPDVLLRDVIETLRPDPERPNGICLIATRVGIETLRYLGIGARPLVVEAIAGNAAWVEWMKAGAPGAFPADAWNVVASSPSDATTVLGEDARLLSRPGFAGHLVVEVTETSEPIILDLDARQFARPSRGIETPDAAIAYWRPGVGAGVDLDDGGVLIYRPHPSPPRFADAIDWRRSARLAGPAIRAVRDRLNGDALG